MIDRDGDLSALSVGERAYTQLRDDIFSATLLPDARLRLDELKKRYGVSVTTLREVLSRLAMEGFVVAEGNRGFAVSPVSRAELREIGDLRVLLENHALGLSFAAGDVDCPTICFLNEELFRLVGLIDQRNEVLELGLFFVLQLR